MNAELCGAWSNDRLKFQANIVGDLENVAMKSLGLPDRGRILDVGCGNGAVGERLRRAYPALDIHGLERDPTLAREAERVLTPGRVLEADALAFDWSTLEERYDCTYARLLLRHVSAPEAVVAGMVRATRRKGRVILLDADDALLNMIPSVDGLDEALHAAHSVLRASGADPKIAMRLAELARGAGLTELRTTIVVMTTRGLDGVMGRRGVESFCRVLSFLWCDPKTGEVREDRRDLARNIELWSDRDDAFGMWALAVVSGVRA